MSVKKIHDNQPKEFEFSEENLKKSLQKERQEFYKLLDSDNKKIGIKSFLNKIKPNWK